MIATWVTGVTASGAVLRVEVNPNDLETTYRFEYVTEASFQAKGFAGATVLPPSGKASLGSGTTPLKAAQSAGGLAPLTAYRYRAVATNSAGTTPGPDRVLATEGFDPGFRLPDARAWEMVSPVDKGGGSIARPEALFGGGQIQAAAGGSAVTYGSATAFGSPAGAPPVSQYVSRRTPAGWATENVSAPLESAAYGDEPDGAPYRLFAGDLSGALLFGGLACRGELPGCPVPNPPLAGSGAPAGYMAYYLRSAASGTFASLLSGADVAHATGVAPPAFEVSFAAASPSLSHVVLSSCAALTSNATEVADGGESCDADFPNLYVRSAGGLSLVNVLPGEGGGTPGAAIAAPSGAVSSDGSRVYWALGGNLYLRDGAQTLQIDQAQGGGGTFQAATPDGAAAFFTKASHLYRFTTATKTAVDLTPGGGVVGVLGASADGERVYYQDAGGLRLWHGGVTTTVAPGADATAASDYPPATATARVSADGTRLAFLSSADLTGYEAVDADTGQPVDELYLYGPPPGGGAATLVCASCNPTGERPRGPTSIPGALVNGSTRAYRPRVLSANGSRLFFETADALVVHDTNSLADVYQWEAAGSGDCVRTPGCVNLISSGRSPDGATFLDASADGSDVYFVTGESLAVHADPPGSIDLYDARVGGGLPEALPPEICVGDACQSLPSPPDDPTPGTLIPNAGNPPLKVFGQKGRKHKKKQRKRKQRKRHGKIASSRGHRAR